MSGTKTYKAPLQDLDGQMACQSMRMFSRKRDCAWRDYLLKPLCRMILSFYQLM